MKKTILLFAFALGIISLNSCSRGYGCPYTMDETIQNQSTELAERRAQNIAEVKDEESITTQVESPVTTVFAD